MFCAHIPKLDSSASCFIQSRTLVARLTLCRRRNDMSETYPSGCAGGAIRAESGHVAALRAVDWLYLAAAPTFAIMALLGRSRRRAGGYLVLGGGAYGAAE